MSITIIDSDCQKNSKIVHFRKPRPGPELNLIDAFLDSMVLRVPRGHSAYVFREAKLESGFPDLIIVVWKGNIADHWTCERQHVNTADLRIMHFLHQQNGAEDQIVRELYGEKIEANLNRLLDADLIQLKKGIWMPAKVTKAYAVSHIIAIEAKIGKWADVLMQASLNTWFASKSYILLPKMPCTRRLDEARSFGVNVCTLDNPEMLNVDSERNCLPRSYASWLLNEWTWKICKNGGQL